MSKYLIGDVVWAIVLFSDGTGSKMRPAIIVDIKEPPPKYLLVECSSLKDKHSSQKGLTITSRDVRYTECGFKEDTFITQNKCWIPERLLKPHPSYGPNPMGKCNFIDEVKKLIGKS